MFFAFVWMATNIAGGFSTEQNAFAATSLTANLTSSATTINVTSTEGFPDPGILVIGEERIAYSATTATTFVGSIAQPMARGTEGTTAAPHNEDDVVRAIPISMVNTTVSYNVAVIADASGLWSGITISLAIARLLGAFLTLPVAFLGTNLEILTYIWGIMMAGMLITIGIKMMGARRFI